MKFIVIIIFALLCNTATQAQQASTSKQQKLQLSSVQGASKKETLNAPALKTGKSKEVKITPQGAAKKSEKSEVIIREPAAPAPPGVLTLTR